MLHWLLAVVGAGVLMAVAVFLVNSYRLYRQWNRED